jgi:hypothetical protein
MQWRRGILFAAVHLTVVLPIVVSLEIDDAAMLRRQHERFKLPAVPVPAASASEPAADTDSIDMCSLIDQYSPREDIVGIANPFAISVTEWRAFCPPRWSISGMLISNAWAPLTSARFAKERIVDVIFVLLIAVQWLLIGGFPLRPHRELWGDPATQITACTVAAGVLSFVPNVEQFCTLPMFYALAAWFWWLSLVATKLFRSMLGFAKGWRLRHAE